MTATAIEAWDERWATPEGLRVTAQGYVRKDGTPYS
jgi:hypothetical protein